MEILFETAINLIKEDDKLSSYSIDAQGTFVDLIKNCSHEVLIEIINTFLISFGPNANLFFLQSVCFLLDNNFDQSQVSLSKAVSLKRERSNKGQDEAFQVLKSEIFLRQTNYENKDGFFEGGLFQGKWALRPETEEPFIKSDLTDNKKDFLLRKKAIDNEIPSILFISMARAGSSGISAQLAKFIGAVPVFVEQHVVPLEQTIGLGFLLDFMRGGAVTYSHPRPSKQNINVLKTAKLTKFFIHVRDPRQCFLSNYFRMHATGDWTYFRQYYNELPLEYDGLACSKQIDWHIDNIYEHYWINWIQDWLDFSTSKPNDFEIKFVTYETFMKDPLTYYKDIGEFFDFDWKAYTKEDLLIREPEPKTEVSGRFDYWRQKLTPLQVERLQYLTPDCLLEKFDWER